MQKTKDDLHSEIEHLKSRLADAQHEKAVAQADAAHWRSVAEETAKRMPLGRSPMSRDEDIAIAECLRDLLDCRVTDLQNEAAQDTDDNE